MIAVKPIYEDGKVKLPPDFAGRKPCEVTVLFPDAASSGRKLGDSERFRRAAGAWADMDCEELKRLIYEARKDSKPRERRQWTDT